MSDNMNLTQWLEAFELGHFDSPDIDTQIHAGWYDWFCKDSSLRNRLKALAPKVKQVCKLFDQKFLDTHYIFFKNNAPLFSSTYDSFSICEVGSGNVVYWIAPKLTYKQNFGQAELCGRDNEFKEPLVIGSWKEVIGYLSLGRQ